MKTVRSQGTEPRGTAALSMGDLSCEEAVRLSCLTVREYASLSISTVSLVDRIAALYTDT